MKKMNKKGFTIVELVIVIAVIAILAGVMIPTFAGMVARANESAALQAATTEFKNLLLEEEFNGNLDFNPDVNGVDLYIKATQSGKDYYFKVVNGEISYDESATAATVSTRATTSASGFEPIANSNAYKFEAKLPTPVTP